MTGQRDGQRSKVYQAESLVMRLFDRSAEHPTISLAGSTVTLPIERHFGRVGDVQSYVDRVLGLAWVRRRWPTAGPVTVRTRSGTGTAHYEAAGAVMALPPPVAGQAWALRELVVLHELAHHLAGDDPPHGPVFTGTLLELVDGVIGPEAAWLLRVTYHDVGVRIG